jgi:uncharacterized protein (DUF934 family)
MPTRHVLRGDHRAVGPIVCDKAKTLTRCGVMAVQQGETLIVHWCRQAGAIMTSLKGPRRFWPELGARWRQAPSAAAKNQATLPSN